MIRALLTGLCALYLLCAPIFAQDLPAAERLTPEEVTELATMLEATMIASGDLNRVEQDALQLHALVLRDIGEETRSAIAVERLLVLAATMQGRDSEGLSLAQSMMQKSVKVLSADDALAYRAIAAFAVAANIAGENDAAMDLLTQGVIEAGKHISPDDPALFEMRLIQAKIAVEENNLSLANTIYAQMDESLSSRTDAEARALQPVVLFGWADLAEKAGDTEANAALLQKTIAALDLQFGDIKHPRMVPMRLEAVSRLAEALFLLGREGEVPALLRPLLDEVAIVYGTDSILWANLAFPLAVALVGNDPASPHTDEATALLRQTVAIWEQNFDPEVIDLLRARINLAMLLTSAGAHTEALHQISQMHGAPLPGVRSQMVYVLHQAETAGVISRDEAVDAVLNILQAQQTSGAGAAQRLLAERLASGSSENAALLRAETDARSRREAAQAALTELTSQPLDRRDEAETQVLRAKLDAAKDAESAAKAKLRTLAPDLAAATGRLPLGLAEIQKTLSPDQALVVIDSPAHDQDVGLIVAVTADAVDWHSFQSDHAQIAAAVTTLRSSIDLRLGVRAAAALTDAPATAPVAFDLDLSYWLYRETLGQVAPTLSGKTELLMDIRGVLSSLPPALLVQSPPQSTDLSKADWLIRHASLTILPAISALRANETTQPPATGFMAFADADYSDAPWLAGLAPLPETAAEVREVGRAFNAPEDSIFLADAARESTVRTADLSEIGVLYFATHGLKAGDRLADVVMPEPGLVLTPDPEDSGEDGVLLASDIAELHLNARVVVLSACNTAAGDSADGETLSGLAQSFLYAGARSLLVSHWPVESKSAVALMTATFRAQADTTLSLPEAQRRAIVSMIDAPQDPRWSHPAYWAPFVFVGR